MYPRVSVIIPAFNAERTIKDLLISLNNQNFSADKSEIIVVNDGSTDNTEPILKKLQQRYSITLLTHDQNRGLAAARNTGIRNSRGKILIFIDADMIVDDTYIENHVNFHNNQKVVGLIGGILPADSVKYDKYQKYLYESRRGIKKYHPKIPIPYTVFLFNNSSIKRKVIETCGMFDENIKLYGGEDTEYSYRISQAFPKGFFCSYSLTALHNHYRKFQDALDNLSRFAKTNIPYLINKHPEMADIYGLKYIAATYGGSFFHRFLGKVIASKTCFTINKFFYKIVPFPLSVFFTRLLMASVIFRNVTPELKK